MTESVTGAGDALERILAFLHAIGIEVREAPVSGDAFLPGVRIEDGALVVDRATLRWPGDLLHEAGHIAVTPAALRPALPGVLDTLPVDAHGTGCTLASAIAAQLCNGLSLANACEAAIDYVARGLQQGYTPGRSTVLVLDHFGAASHA